MRNSKLEGLIELRNLRLDIEHLALAAFGRSIKLAQIGGQCVVCGKFNINFPTLRDVENYRITGCCPECFLKH